MKLKNNLQNKLIHLQGRDLFCLEPGEVKDVPNDIAKIWVNVKGVEKIKEETKKTTK